MNKKLSFILALCISITFLSSCKNNKAIDTMSKSPISKNTNVTQKAEKFYTPYTGEQVTKEISEKLAFMAIIENSKDARPQSGLVDADIVYETMAEGGIPRFIALFQKNDPKKIGPIRSARAYFINIANEYNLPFAHCGYSDEAKDMIEKGKLMSLNEFFNGGSFWRDKERKAPHNLYTSADNLRKLVASKGYVKPSYVKFSFDKTYWDSNSLSAANNVVLKLNRYYTTSYSLKDGKYIKSMDGTTAANKEDSKPIAVSNIVIQVTDIRLQEDGKHLDIDLTGKGNGYVISNGKFIKVTWSKKSIGSQTTLTDENGKPVPLSPGNTWWHIIDKTGSVNIN